MMGRDETIHAFWSSFGILAFEENSVPTNETIKAMGLEPFPRITYDVVDGSSWGSEVAMSAMIHSKSSSWREAVDIKNAISKYLGDSGKQFDCENGSIWIKKADPFAQRTGTLEDDTVRQYLINISVENHIFE